LASGILKEIDIKRSFDDQSTGAARFLPEVVAELYEDAILR
jgi:hypothetical protein